MYIKVGHKGVYISRTCFLMNEIESKISNLDFLVTVFLTNDLHHDAFVDYLYFYRPSAD